MSSKATGTIRIYKALHTVRKPQIVSKSQIFIKSKEIVNLNVFCKKILNNCDYDFEFEF